MSKTTPIPDNISKEGLLSFFKKFHTENAQELLPARFYFVEIIGKRWSFLCGSREAIPSIIQRVELSPKYGICILPPTGDKQTEAEQSVLTRLDEAIKKLNALIATVSSDESHKD